MHFTSKHKTEPGTSETKLHVAIVLTPCTDSCVNLLGSVDLFFLFAVPEGHDYMSLPHFMTPAWS